MRDGIDWGCHGGKHPHIKAAMHSAIDVDDADELLRSELSLFLVS